MTVGVFLCRWPTGAVEAELVHGVLLFEGTFGDEDAEIARRTYPGRRILVNRDGGPEIHPAGPATPTSLLDR